MDEIINMPQVEEGDLVVKFSKPFVFENKTYTEVDLRGLEDLNGEDLCRADRAVRAQGNTAPMTEMTPDMACFLSSASAHLPVEFFKALPIRTLFRVFCSVGTNNPTGNKKNVCRPVGAAAHGR